MNGTAQTTDPQFLSLMVEVPGNQPMVWRVPSTGMLFGSALGCDIRLPIDHPPVTLMVAPVVDSSGISARIRPMAPLLEIRHNGIEWKGDSLPAGAKLQIGSLAITILNGSAQTLLQSPTQQTYLPTAAQPAQSTGTEIDPKPKKKVSWLRRWQRSLEMRESTLMATQSWAPPPVAPVVVPQLAPQSASPSMQNSGLGDQRWRELEEWIQSAREQAEACAKERANLKIIQNDMDTLGKTLQQSRAELTNAWAEFRQAEQSSQKEHKQGLARIEEARQSILAQSKSVADYHAQIDAELQNAQNELNTRLQRLETEKHLAKTDAQQLHDQLEADSLRAQQEADNHRNQLEGEKNAGLYATNQLAPTLALTPASPSAQAIDLPPDPITKLPSHPWAEPEEVAPSLGEMNDQITNLLNQFAANHAALSETTPEIFPSFPAINPEITTPLTTNDELPLHAHIENEIDADAETSEDSTATALTEDWDGEDQENFLPPPEEIELEAFRQWCLERLRTAAEEASRQIALQPQGSTAVHENTQIIGFARKMLDQGLATPNLLNPLTKLAGLQRISMEDLLTRMGVFTTHQIATMGLGCANDLVLSRWFILDLPALDATDIDRELVFRVLDPQINQARILRVLAPREARKPGRADEYIKRHLACSKIDSEHLIPTVECLELAGLPCVIQQVINGTPFQSWPSMGGSAPVWYRLFLQAAVALRDLHQAGLFHGHLTASDLLLKPEGLLLLTDHATPVWLAPNASQTPDGPGGDLVALAHIGRQWWLGPQGENQRHMPEPLATVLARMEPDHPTAITSAKTLAEELDRAGILLPPGAAAWQRFIEEHRGPLASQETDQEADSETYSEDETEFLRRTA